MVADSLIPVLVVGGVAVKWDELLRDLLIGDRPFLPVELISASA